MDPTTRLFVLGAVCIVAVFFFYRMVILRLLRRQGYAPPVGNADLSLDGQVALSRATYERSAAAWDKERSWPNDEEFERFRFVCTAGTVLDLGCGNGCDAQLFGAAYRYVGLDVSSALLRLARNRNPDRILVRGEFTALPFSDGTFDGFWSLYALSHVPSVHITNVLSELRRVLKPGAGGMIVTNLGGREELWETEAGPKYITEYGRGRFEKLLRAAGFEIRSSSDNGSAVELGDPAHMTITVVAI